MIIIEDMDMPDRCTKCFAYSGVSDGICLIGESYGGIKYMSSDPEFGRQYWCPLYGIDISKEELMEKLL